MKTRYFFTIIFSILAAFMFAQETPTSTPTGYRGPGYGFPITNIGHNPPDTGMVVVTKVWRGRPAPFWEYPDSVSFIGGGGSVVDSNGMFDAKNQLGSWEVTAYYLPSTHSGYIREKGAFKLIDSTLNQYDNEILFEAVGSAGASSPPYVAMGSGVKMPRLEITGDTTEAGGTIKAGYGNDTYNLPVERPDSAGLTAGTYIMGVDEIGALAGTEGWLNVYEGPIAYIRQNGNDVSAEIGNNFLPYSTINAAISDGNTLDLISHRYDPGLYQYSTSATNDTFQLQASPAATLQATTGGGGAALWTPTTGGVFELSGYPSIILDSSNVINSLVDTYTNGNFSISAQIDQFGAYRPAITSYNRAGINRPQRSGTKIVLDVNRVNFIGHAFVFGDSTVFFDVNIKEFNFLNNGTSSVYQEVLARAGNRSGTLLSNGFYRLNVDKFNTFYTGTKGGLFSLGGNAGSTSQMDSCTVIVKVGVINSNQTYSNISEASQYGVELLVDRIMTKFLHSTYQKEIGEIYGNHVFNIGEIVLPGNEIDSSYINYKIGTGRVKRRLFQTYDLGVGASTINLSCDDCIVTKDAAISTKATLDTLSRFNVSGRWQVDTAGYSVIYSTHDVYLYDAYLFNDGTTALVNSGATPINCYVCNSNVTQDRVGANVTVVDLCPNLSDSGNGLFDPANNNDSVRVSQTYLTGNWDIDLTGNVLEIDDGGINYARFSDVQGYMRTDSSFMGVFSAGPGVIENVSLLTAPTTGEIVMGKYPGVTYAHNFPVMQPDQYGAAAGTYYRVVDENGDLAGNNGWMRPHISGSGTPIGSVTPEFVGQEYLDTSGTVWYKSTGLTNTDWVALN